MKSSVCYKYIMAAVSALMLTGLGSCVQDDYGLRGDSGDYDAVALQIKLPEQRTVDPMTRSEAVDFDKVNDLNIFVSENGDIKKRVFIDAATLASVTTDGMELPGQNVTIKQGEYEEGVDKDESGYVKYTIDFLDSFWSGVSMTNCQFHVVANWGKSIPVAEGDAVDGETAVTTVEALKNLKVAATTTTIGNNSYATPDTPNAMYGDQDHNIVETTINNVKTKVVTVPMKRIAAMVTLQMDGTGLARYVVIELQNVELRNVPNSCTLGLDNKPSDYTTEISSYGDLKGGPSVSGGYKLIGNSRFYSGEGDTEFIQGYDEASGYKTIIGGHYPKKGESDNSVSDMTSTFVIPLFMFENRQPEGTSDGSLHEGAHKRPANVTVTSNDYQGAISNYNETGVCSYLEVVGNYTLYDQTNATDIVARGTVTWRFFLGKDATTSFDVERNTNYRITLTLTGSGIGEKDYSWRVNADNLKRPQVVGNPDMVVGGGGEMFCVEFPGQDQGNFKIVPVPGQGDFVFLYSTPNNDKSLSWYTVEKAGNGAYKVHYTAGKQMWFYVARLLPDPESDFNTEDITERKCSVTFSQVGTGSSVTLTFSQYRPVTFSLRPQDLEDHPDDPDLLRAYDILKKYYNHDVKTQGSMRFWVDRIDRDIMPWGFSGIKLHLNRATGFENVYHLIKPLPANYVPELCDSHVNEAQHYLPTGRGYRNSGTGGQLTGYADYIDYSKGSCMVHAAMENYFQHYSENIDTKTGKLNITETPESLLKLQLKDIVRPDDDTSVEGRIYSWCVPSVAGCQLVESLQKFYDNNNITNRGFDPKYPIMPWVSYWTSNAATNDMKDVDAYEQLNINGENRSFVYQFDTGLEYNDYTFDMKDIEGKLFYPARLILPRSSSIKYRLLNIRPDDIAGSGSTN